MVFGKKRQDKKFCPLCGTQLNIDDAYCTNCGYSFEARHKKRKKAIKWKNILILIIVVLAIYLGYRYYNGQPIFPDLKTLLNFTSNQTIK